MSNSFRRDLVDGQAGEKILMDLLLKASISCEQSPERDLDLLGEIAGLPFSIEVKYDMAESRSGNIAIEYYNTKSCKPSGISSTKADLWGLVLINPQTVWIARTADLRKFVGETKPFREYFKAGDGNAAIKLYENYVILSSVFHQVDHLPAEELQGLITSLVKGSNL